jgi:hypothetical protein
MSCCAQEAARAPAVDAAANNNDDDNALTIAETRSSSGTTPNLYLGCSARGDRRALGRRLISLPRPSHVAVAPGDEALAAAPYARQGSWLWSWLRRRRRQEDGGLGLLTTARFADALGLREARAAKSLGVPARLVGHSPLIEAYRHLLPPAKDAAGEEQGAAQPPANGATLACSSCAESRRLNARALLARNFRGEGASRPDGDFSSTDEGDDGTDEQQHQHPHHRHRARRARRDAHSRAAAASGGSVGVAMAWGLAQEGASLFELSRLFPRSLVEESGLHLAGSQALRRLQEQEELDDGGSRPAPPPLPLPLPPMGASPDAIMAHAVRLSRPGADNLLRLWRARLPPALVRALEDAGRAAAAAARGGSACAAAAAAAACDDALWSDAAPAFVAAAGEEGARMVASRMWQDALRLVAVACSSSSSSSDGGKEDEEETEEEDNDEELRLAAAAELAAASALLAALVAPIGPRRALAREHRRRQRRRRRRGGDGGQGALAVAPEYGSEDDVQSEAEDDDDAELPARRAAYRAALLASVGEQEAAEEDEDDDAPLPLLPCCCFVLRRRCQPPGRSTLGYLLLREAVEIKNASPFREVPARGGGGKQHGTRRRHQPLFALSDPGPRDAILPLWAPQAQLHCLSSALPSLLLVHRSATRGARVWRVQRDDAYLSKALAVVGRALVGRHVLPRSAPRPDAYFEPGSGCAYGPFLAHTRRVAAGAALVVESTAGGGGGVALRRWAADADARAFVSD